MNTKISKIFFWFPRVVSVAFLFLLSLLALDVFGVGYSFWEAVGAFLIHLIPSFMVAVFVWLSWKREWIGGIFFVTIGILYVILTRFRMDLDTYVVVSGTAVFIGGIFFLGDYLKKK